MGLVMSAVLLCQGECSRYYEVGQGQGSIDGVDSGPLVCEDCGGALALAAAGIAERRPTMSSVNQHNIERWPFRGLWHRPS